MNKNTKDKISVCLTKETVEKINELARVVRIRNIDNKEKPISLSQLLEVLLISGLENRGEELWA